jgi:hypothetical protein
LKPSPLYSVVTTIQPPTAAMRELGRVLHKVGGSLLVAGDRKGPHEYPLPKAQLLTLSQQIELPLRLPQLLPVNHYVRKNVGYLVAISRQPACIYETDDDNAPNARWKVRSSRTKAISIEKQGWQNVYRHFSRMLLWPRGFPLERILSPNQAQVASNAPQSHVYSPIQQGLADGNPDVDAIWRLTLSSDVRFAVRKSVALQRGVWCPFNSQSTWWWPEVFPLLYLPSYCTFRMTDIWRSYIAQRCVWELGGAVTFHAPEVFQDRNQHNLLRDFEDEIPGYLGNAKICETLAGLRLKQGPVSVGPNLTSCYEALVAAKVFPNKELRLVRAWLADLKKVTTGFVL